ncbi:MAG: hypothetical protein IAE97_00295 [Chthoniobacterales bacterium]|nr:hypothetical protein [Chthoniobacterales bacterium]
MSNDRLQIHATRDFWYPGKEISLHAATFRPDGKLSARVSSIQLERIDEDSLIPVCENDAALRIDETAAQRLMDDLWNCGIRPTNVRHQSDALAATQAHLTDMRRIVFHTNQIPQP